jgi:hypothetical protein
MTKFEKEWWEEQRAKGYDRFLLRAILRAGLPFGILMTLAAILIPIFSHHAIPSVLELVAKFGFYVLAFGAFMGAATWRRNERDYKKPTENDDVA